MLMPPQPAGRVAHLRAPAQLARRAVKDRMSLRSWGGRGSRAVDCAIDT